MANKQRKLKWQDVTLYVMATTTLVALLSYTFVHTGDVLASWIQPGYMGYVAAFGVELGIAGLSLRRTLLKKSNTDSVIVTSTLAVLLLISAFANVYSGFEARTGGLPTLDSVWEIDPVQAIMGVLATAMIPLVVFATGEIVGGDVRRVAIVLEKEESDLKPDVITALKLYSCPCGAGFDTPQEKAIHSRRCTVWKELKQNGTKTKN